MWLKKTFFQLFLEVRKTTELVVYIRLNFTDYIITDDWLLLQSENHLKSLHLPNEPLKITQILRRLTVVGIIGC